MGLSDIEQLLARLSADERLRERFVNDPFSLARELGLSVAATRQLKREAAARYNSFVASPYERRLVELAKLLPLSRRVLGARFSSHFRRFAAEHEPGGIERLIQDAVAFAAYLEERLREERVGSGWTIDVLRYEKARLRAADPNRRLVVAAFRHDISRLVRSVVRREEQPEAVRRPSLAVWWRNRRHTPVRYAVYALPKLFGRQSNASDG